MDSLRARHQDKSNEALLHIIENSENYTAECIEVVSEILDNRMLSDEEIKEVIVPIHINKIRQALKNLDPLNDEIKIPESKYLSKAQIKKLYIEQMKIFMEEKEGFRFDVWSYTVGAVI